ncbi:peptidoglycan recognition protein family protein [Algicella marina]|uniref:N-acetylmuramoyl-L-alanine amidase n=1 Tax=Algicella marina TaxID=2683284 RepID=A0A6P1T5T4_9RHOB|nr:peptidoglycan-binding domain-containing protein [Algicella marina]QHQ37171.1 N-acetylmuramoyl-L-alanine amidase [Algicella marina]
MFTKPNRFVDRVFLHCSASDHASHDNIATIHRWHTDPKPRGNGWSDTGYHYFIRKDGTLENGRPLERTPSAQGGHNTGTIAICLHGLDKPKFTTAQFDQVRGLCLEINNAYHGTVTFHGHKEVAAKACPVFDYRDVLKLDRFGRLGLSGAEAQGLANETHRDADTMPQLRRGDRGEAVALAQSLLMLKDDGIFGPKTDGVVRDFQTAHGLERDGVIGKDTWKALFANERIEHSGAS